jgi:CHAT domain-containing protein/tetratricopeptide (TPR) repeat protein
MLEVTAGSREGWIDELMVAAPGDCRRALLELCEKADASEVAKQLYDEALRLMRVDLGLAERISEVLSWFTEELKLDRPRGQSLRMSAHILYLRGSYEAAVASYQAAQVVFERVGDEVEVARTISAALHSLVYLGRYEQAQTLADRARQVFVDAKDELRLARLDVNLGNLYFRQDRFAEALTMYERGFGMLRSQGDAQDVAVVMRNMAVCELSLSNFDQALAIYRDAREFTEKNNLPLLVAEADYNIAYLYYLRGEYNRAVELYEAARKNCATIGDAYHRSLCDLDQAEIYLEVNLIDEAGELAARAFTGFQQLDMRYESAKALTFHAIAAGRLGKYDRALEWLKLAQSLFAQEKNLLWPALIDLYKAVVLFEQRKYGKSRQSCQRALRLFRNQQTNGKAALCEILLARLDHALHHSEEAKSHCLNALALVNNIEAPAVKLQVHLLLGQVSESAGAMEEAYSAYQEAHQYLEALRSPVQIDEIKVAFLKDKLSVYEGLVGLSLRQNDWRQALDFIERAKSRSLADMIASRVHALRPKAESVGELARRLETVGDKLAGLRHQQARDSLRVDGTSAARSAQLSEQSHAYEREFGQITSQVASADPHYAAVVNAGTASVESIQASIGPDTLILEYYEARGTVYACVIGREQLRILPVATSLDVRRLFRLLQLQLTKFSLGAEYVALFASQMRLTADAHLHELYSALIAPIRSDLLAGHLVIVPHGILHCLPFHALFDGSRYLIDDFSISYAPSASVYNLCTLTAAAATEQSLVMGVPDSLAPNIGDEASVIAAILPECRLFVGETATGACLQEHASSSRVVHIATHGQFCENPAFSSVRLADTTVGLIDLYQLRLDAELVTLSGCGTGLHVVVGGDELMGLSRGLLYAGARSVLATLWDVNDASTAELMGSFYEHWATVPNRGLALQRAICGLRETHPHPYYWAPFVLIGKHL